MTVDDGLRKADGRAVAGATLLVAGMLLGATAIPASLEAQRVEVRERIAQERAVQESRRAPATEAEFVQWVRRLQQLQERELRLVGELRALAHEEGAAARRRAVELELRDVARDVVRVRSGLDAMCTRAGDEPEGWMGLTFTGSYRVVKRNDEKPVFTFLAYPVVEAVEPGSPAERAGVEVGDTVVALAKRDLRQGDVVMADLLRPGTKLPVRVVRAGKGRDVTLRITRRPEAGGAPCRTFTRVAPPGTFAHVWAGEGTPAPAMAPRAPRTPERPQPRVMVRERSPERTMLAPGATPMIYYNATGTTVLFGAELTRVAGDLGEVLGVAEGVLVTSVLPGGPMEAAGVRGGDVIVKAGEIAVVTPRDLQRARWDTEAREIPLELVRKQKRVRVALRW